jgi:hypothetical protein
MDLIIKFISWSIIQLFRLMYYIVWLTTYSIKYKKYTPKINSKNKNLAINIPCHGMGHISRAELLIQIIEENTQHKVKVVFFEKNGKSNIPNLFLEKLQNMDVKIYYLESCGFIYSKFSVNYIKTFINAIRKSYKVWQDQIFRERMYNYYRTDLILDFFDINSIISRNIIKSQMPIKYMLVASRKCFKIKNKYLKFDYMITETIFNFIKEKKNIYFQFPIKINIIENIQTLPLYKLVNKVQLNKNEKKIILGYFLNKNYISQIKPFCRIFSDYEFKFFTYIDEMEKDNNIEVYPVSNFYYKILEKSSGLICSSGSSSPIEAVYLNIPVLLIPTHLEQRNISLQYNNYFNKIFYILENPIKEKFKSNLIINFIRFIKYIENNNDKKYLQQCNQALQYRLRLNNIIQDIL